MKKFLHEFKAFALKGNVMDLAVGVIIGAAFQSIVTSLTNDILNPLRLGAFISAVLNFVIMAFVLFCIVKAMNRLMALGRPKKEEAPAAPKGPTQEELLAGILAELRAQNDRETALTK